MIDSMKTRYTYNHYIHISILCIWGLALAACSTVSGVPEGDKLYTGIKKIEMVNYEKGDHFDITEEEVEAALDCPPNGSLFSSSYYRSPLQWRLWAWNAYHDKDSKFANWMTKSFGKAPVLMSTVNSELRASVAQSTLRAHGYFRGMVGSYEVPSKNPKKAKVGYLVNYGHLFTIDSLQYVNFPAEALHMIDSTSYDTFIGPDEPFDVATLDNERNRLSSLFRNNGYFYYQPGYASFLADTFAVPGKVQLKLQLVDSLPERVMHKWYIGRVTANFRKTYMEKLTQSTVGRRITINYNGKKPPLRTRVLMNDLKIRPGRLFSYSDYLESASKLNSNGLFSMVDFNFTPRDSSELCDTLDLDLNCVFDKPYDFYVESNIKGKTTGFLGPQLIVGFTKRNAFRGGEKLDINLHGSYEWQTGHSFEGSSSEMNSYEYGGDVSVEFPRLVLPWKLNDSRRPNQAANGVRRRRTRYFSTPTTTLKISRNIVRRSGFFKRHILSGELTYKIQKNAYWSHQYTPLSVEYNYLKSGTEKFYDLLNTHPYLMATMLDQFIPKMKYTISYTNSSKSRNPVYWQASVSESGNLLSLGYLASGKSWNKKGKEMFKNAYAQFLKFETDFTKTWKTSDHSQLVAHLSAGYSWAYGNSDLMPYTESFWVGGANSIRAFTVRSIGPGKFHSADKRWRFIEEVGDIKLQLNLEYRPRLFGNLYGALFIDAGNVWNTKDGQGIDGGFESSQFLNQMALGTGVGLRYDLDFFIVRLDWGIGIHAPYDTGKSGYYNIPSFSDGQSLHFAIGYPF